MAEPAKRKRGCLFYGCLGSLVLVLMIVIGGYLGFRFAVARFTDPHRSPLPASTLSTEDLRRVQERIVNFSRAVDAGKPGGSLTLTSEEANGLIQADPGWSFLKDAIYVTFESNRLKAQISLPAERLGSPRLKGRFLNASGTFNLSFLNGQLYVSPETLAAKGEQVPDYVMKHVRAHNFAPSFTNAEVNAVLNKLQEVSIRDGKLFVVPKPVK